MIVTIVDTVKPLYNDHPQSPKIVAVVDGWSLFKDYLCYKRSNWDLDVVVIVGQVVAIWRWSLVQV